MYSSAGGRAQSARWGRDNGESPRTDTSEHRAHFQAERLNWGVKRGAFFCSFLEVLQDNMITAQGPREASVQNET